jgi:hypothetical protein
MDRTFLVVNTSVFNVCSVSKVRLGLVTTPYVAFVAVLALDRSGLTDHLIDFLLGPSPNSTLANPHVDQFSFSLPNLHTISLRNFSFLDVWIEWYALDRSQARATG